MFNLTDVNLPRVAIFLLLAFWGASNVADANQQQEPTENSLYLVFSDERFGYIDQVGRMVIKPTFEYAKQFQNGLAVIGIDGKWERGDGKWKRESPDTQWEYRGGRYGLIDQSGKVAVAPRFQELKSFANGYAAAKLGGKWGMIDTKGRFIIEPQYDEVADVQEDFFRFRVGKLWGYCHVNDGVVVSPKYHSARDFSEGRAAVSEQPGHWQAIDQAGKLVIKTPYEFVGSFSGGFARVGMKGKMGFVNHDGKLVVPIQYVYAEDFSEGVAAVAVKRDFGFIDQQGKLVIPYQFQRAQPFSEGLAAVHDGTNWKYITQEGKVQFDIRLFYFAQKVLVSPFHNGRAAVRAEDGSAPTGGSWGAINKEGKLVVPPIYFLPVVYQGELAKVAFWEDLSPFGLRYLNRSGDLIWPKPEPNEPHTFRDPNGQIVSIVASSDEKQLAAATRDSPSPFGSIYLWDLERNTLQSVLERTVFTSSSMEFAPNKRDLISVDEGKVTIRNENGEESKIPYFGAAICYAPDGKELIIGQFNKLVWWDLENNRVTSSKTWPEKVYEIRLFPDQNTFIGKTGSQFFIIRKGENPMTFRDPSDIESVAVSADGKRIFSASHLRVVEWDALTGKRIGTVLKDSNYRYLAIEASPCGQWLAVSLIRIASVKPTFEVWIIDNKSREVLRKFQGHRAPVRALHFLPKSQKLVSGSDDWTVKVWDLSGINDDDPK